MRIAWSNSLLPEAAGGRKEEERCPSRTRRKTEKGPGPVARSRREVLGLDGPAGLEPARVGRPKGSRLPEPTRRAILLMKEAHPDWGIDRLHDMLRRTEGFQASATAISNLLKEEGMVLVYEESDAPRGMVPESGPDSVVRHDGEDSGYISAAWHISRE